MKYKHVNWYLLLLLIVSGVDLNLNAESYDPSTSVFRFQKQMAKRGNAESQFKLGLMYETGSGVNNSSVLAIVWYKKAALQSYKPASNRLTYLEIKKSGFNDNHKKWLDELKNDAQFNEGEALFLLGQMYAEGTGVNKDLNKAQDLLQKAVQGNIPGSEAEITRVEHELNALEEQKKKSEKNDKKKSVAAVVVKKPLKSKTKPRVVTTAPQANITRKTATSKPVRTTHKPKATTQKPKKKQFTKTKPEPVQVKLTPPKKLAEEKEQHPMDTICGGRNRYSRGCR
jgi:Sel1 repeat-containing protein